MVEKVLLFLKSLISHWINAVSGTILAVVLTFGPNFIHEGYLGWVQFLIAMIAILLACYLAWEEQYQKNLALIQRLRQVEDKTPKFKVSLIDERSNAMRDLRQTIKRETQKANKAMKHAPAPGLFSVAADMFNPTRDSWRHYLERLKNFEKRVDVIEKNAQSIINLMIENIGRVSDEEINIVLRPIGANFLPSFYETEIEAEMPSEPGFRLGFSDIDHRPKQGIRRSTLEAGEALLEIEINRMHPGEVAHASYYPIFLKLTGHNPEISYEIRSKRSSSVIKNKLKIRP